MGSISSRGVTQTLEEYKAWLAYPAEVSQPDIGGIRSLASISSRGFTQTLEEYKAWPAYPAVVSPRHWRNTRPGQHIQQRCHPDIGGIQGQASISSRSVTQTLEEYKAWPAHPAEVSPRHSRNARHGQHIQQ